MLYRSSHYEQRYVVNECTATKYYFMLRNDVMLSTTLPSKPEEPIYFFADPPHLIKSFRTSLLNNDVVLLNGCVAKYNLLTSVVGNKILIFRIKAATFRFLLL